MESIKHYLASIFDTDKKCFTCEFVLFFFGFIHLLLSEMSVCISQCDINGTDEHSAKIDKNE